LSRSIVTHAGEIRNETIRKAYALDPLPG